MVKKFKRIVSDEGKDYMIFTWKWCAQCSTMMVVCPNCGNNCCNAGFGTVSKKTNNVVPGHGLTRQTKPGSGKWVKRKGVKHCPFCNLAYQFQHHCWKTNTAPPPPSKKEQKRLKKEMDDAWDKFWK